MRLGVNIDHIATLRQQRRGHFPDPIEAARVCEKAGAASIVCHLREDRRHIQDGDVQKLRKTIRTRLNLEMSIAKSIVDVALKVRPDSVTLVPERRQELTTEGGLDAVRLMRQLKVLVRDFHQAKIAVSLFVDPEASQLEAARDCGAGIVELHTGSYADAKTAVLRLGKLAALKKAALAARKLELKAAAGHGLDYKNVGAIVKIAEIEELNIGFSIVSRALFTGLNEAVREMRRLMAS